MSGSSNLDSFRDEIHVIKRDHETKNSCIWSNEEMNLTRHLNLLIGKAYAKLKCI